MADAPLLALVPFAEQARIAADSFDRFRLGLLSVPGVTPEVAAPVLEAALAATNEMIDLAEQGHMNAALQAALHPRQVDLFAPMIDPAATVPFRRPTLEGRPT